MAAFDRYDLNTAGKGENVREDVENTIYNIAPTRTPFMTGAGRGSADNTLHEWLTDDLGSVDENNARIDGADLGADVSSAATRLANQMQISDKPVIVSGRADAVNKIGRKTELAYQLAKAAKALKRDMEAISTGIQPAAAGTSGSVASKTAGVQAFIRTNVDLGATGTAPTLSGSTNGFPDAGPGAGTLRAATETIIRAELRAAYEAGGEPETIMLAPILKQSMSEYLFGSTAKVATLYSDLQQTKGQAVASGAVDVFVSDFGAMRLVPNLFLGHASGAVDSTVMLLLQMSTWKIAYLRGFRTNTIARTGDAEKRQLLVDWGVVCTSENANAAVHDIDSAVAITA